MPAVVAPVTVSLTFDDGNADTVSAAPIMQASGMHGTYYTNSGTIGLPGYQTRADLASLYAAGNEIAGHTVNHPDLTTLSTAEAQREICLDRDTLLSWGYPVQSFAYPFAATNNTIDGLAATCGYNSARNLGDIQSRFGCAGCDYAESIPPANPYELAALDEADDTWTLADLESTVTNAQSNGGGWVILTFHHICDGDCDPLAVTPELFQQFVTWLATQSANGTTVKTVAQVIGGTTKPAVTVPPATATDTINNPSLETINTTTGMPDCWQEAGFGTNTASWATVSPGHTGNVAAQLTVSAYTDGDAKVMPQLDLGTCAPTATPGTSYQLGTWYTSTANTQFEVYLRTTSGAWVYWDSSPWFVPATAWTQATWVTAPIPAGYDGIDFGLNLFSVGTLTTDDYSIAPAATPLVTTATVTPVNPNGANGWYNSQPTVSLSVSNDGVASTTQYSFDGTTWTTYTVPVVIPTNRSTFYYRSVTAQTTEATQSLTFAVDTDLPTVVAAFNDATRTFSAFGSDVTSGPNQIRYSYDAGVTWANYTAPVTVDNSAYSVEVEAIDAAGNISLPVTITEAPITTATVSPIAADGLAGWYKTPPTVTLTAGAHPAADQVTHYSYDNVTWLTYTAPIVVPDGTSTLYYYTSGAGFAEVTHTLGFSVDSIAPTVTASYNPTTRIYSATATDAGSGLASFEQSIDGGAWTPYAGPTVASNSSIAVEFRATDLAGNVSASVPLAIAAVTTAAVSPATPNGQAGWYTVAPTVILSTGGATAGQVTQYSFDGTTWITYAGPITIPAGFSTLSYRTIGNSVTETAQTLSFSVDLDAPSVTPAFNSATRTWSATATDGTSGVASILVRVPGGAWSAYTAPVAIGHGSLSLEFEATDLAGHVSAVVPLKAGAITTASVSPAIANGSAGWYVTAPVVTLGTTGAASLGSPSSGQVTQYSYDGSTWITYSTPLTVPNGSRTLSFRTVGAGVTEATQTLHFTVDTVAPTVTPTFNGTTRAYSATATDATSGLSVIQTSTSGGPWVTYTGPIAVGTSSVTVQFRAIDVAGNISSVVSLSTATKVTATVSPVTPNGAGGWYVSTPKVTLSATGLGLNEHIQYSLNSTTWVNYSAAVTMPAGVDTFKYRTSATGSAVGTIIIKVDVSVPKVAAKYTASTRTVTATATDVGSGVSVIDWRITGHAWAKYTGALHPSSAAQTLQFQSLDVAGHASAVLSISVPKLVVKTASTETVTLTPVTVAYLHSRTVRVQVGSGGRAATGTVEIVLDGKNYKSAALKSGAATISLSKTLKVGKHTVVGRYLGSARSAVATSRTAVLTVTKAKIKVTLSKASATVLASKTTLLGVTSPLHLVQVKVRVVGSKVIPRGKVVITVNGKKLRTVTLTEARAGKIVIALPKFKKSTDKVTVRARFEGTKSLKSAKSKKMIIHLK